MMVSPLRTGPNAIMSCQGESDALSPQAAGLGSLRRVGRAQVLCQFAGPFVQHYTGFLGRVVRIAQGVDLAQVLIAVLVMQIDVRTGCVGFASAGIGEDEVVVAVDVDLQFAAMAFPIVVP